MPVAHVVNVYINTRVPPASVRESHTRVFVSTALATYRMIVRWLLYALQAITLSVHARAAVRCTCISVGDVSLLTGAGTGPTLFSTRPSVRNTTESLFGKVNGTLACRCVDRPGPGTVAYILSASGPRSCLGVAMIRKVCSDLQILGLMTCSTFWSAGAAGVASDVVTGIDVLADVAHRTYMSGLGAARSRICNSTSFRGVVDTVVAAPELRTSANTPPATDLLLAG